MLTNIHFTSYTNVSICIGMSPSLSGAIIGLAPFAALISALIFSSWTNYSYRRPLLASLIMLTTGNLLYGLALQVLL